MPAHETKEEQVQRELAAFVEHINNLLAADADLVEVLPITDTSIFFNICHNGYLLAKLVNAIKPNTLDASKLKKSVHKDNISTPGSTDAWEIASNNNLFLEGCKKLGIKVVNVGSDDILNENVDLVLGLVWQLIRHHLLEGVNVVSHPELIRLLQKGETIQTLIELTPEKILLRWFNYHLKRAGHNRTVSNFSGDISDSVNYLVLMKQIAPRRCDHELIDSALALPDTPENLEARAAAVLKNAELLNSRKFVTAKDIVSGNSRLNLAFAATLFNMNIGIRLPTEEEIAAIYDELEALKNRVAELEQLVQKGELEAARLRSAGETLEETLHQERDDNEKKLAELKAALDDVTAKFASGASFSSHLEQKLKEAEAKLAAQNEQASKQAEEIRRHRDVLRDVLSRYGNVLGEKEALDARVKALAESGATTGPSGSSLKRHSSILNHPDDNAPTSPSPYTVSQTGFVSLASHDQLVTDLLQKFTESLAAEKESNAAYRAAQATATLGLMELAQVHLQQIKLDGFDPSAVLEATLSAQPSLEALRKLVLQLIELSKAQATKINTLEAALLKKTQMTELMTAKVREIAEELNQKKKEEVKEKKGFFS